jgi:hypothetical protein
MRNTSCNNTVIYPGIRQGYDVIVIGAGASGIPAAIGAARKGASVLLLEEDQQVGGACVDQYVAMICDTGKSNGGIYGELIDRIHRNYNLNVGKIEHQWSLWYLPSDYLRIVMEMIHAEENLELLCGVRRCRPIMTTRDGIPSAEGVVISKGDKEFRIGSKVIIDATGSAEMAHFAGCQTYYGRDSKDDFNEEFAPNESDDKVQLCTWQYISQRMKSASPFNMKGVKARPMESGYGWIEEDDEESWQRNSGMYLHWGCRVRCKDTRDPISVADAQREALTLMKDDLDILRKNGYAVHLAPKIGVRESRRLVGETIITANDLLNGKIPEDTIFITERGMDIWTEGKKCMDYPSVKKYGIPYRSLIPKDMGGIIVVGKAISGTHLAMSAYRTQGILGYVGEAGGTAAAMCATRNIRPLELNCNDLVDTLRSQYQF